MRACGASVGHYLSQMRWIHPAKRVWPLRHQLMMGRSWKMKHQGQPLFEPNPEDVAEIVISEDDESDFPIEVPGAAPTPRSV